MMRKILLIVCALSMFLPVLGFALPHLAVLEAVLDAGIDPSAGPLVTSKIEEAFVNSGKYTVLDRANIDRVLQEKEFQLSSGIVRNEEVRQAGEYLGADAVVVATVSRIGQTYVVSAKMIDVVSGEIAAQTSSEKAGRIDVLLEVARLVGGRLAGTDIFIVSVEEERAQELVKEEEAPPPKEKAAEEAPPRVREEKPAEEPAKEPYVAPAPPKRAWEKPFIFGIRGGANWSTVSWETDWYSLVGDTLIYKYEPYATFGGNVGIYFVVNTSRFLALQMELDYSQKGYEADFEEFNGFFGEYYDGTNVFTFNYLEIPMLAKFRIPGRFSPYALLGVYFSLWLNGTIENVYEDEFYQDYYDTNYTNPDDLEDWWGFNSLDFGWVAGLGIDVYLGSFVLNAEVKYSGGVLYVDELDEITNGTFTVTAGVGWAF